MVIAIVLFCLRWIYTLDVRTQIFYRALKDIFVSVLMYSGRPMMVIYSAACFAWEL